MYFFSIVYYILFFYSNILLHIFYNSKIAFYFCKIIKFLRKSKSSHMRSSIFVRTNIEQTNVETYKSIKSYIISNKIVRKSRYM